MACHKATASQAKKAKRVGYLHVAGLLHQHQAGMSVAVAAQRLARPLPEDAGEPLLRALLLQLVQLVC